MSNIHNERWIEEQYQAFQEALDKRYYKTAHGLIEETKDANFRDEAYEMNRQLNLAMYNNFPQTETPKELVQAEESSLQEKANIY